MVRFSSTTSRLRSDSISGIRRLPDERWMNRLRGVAAGRAPEEKQLTARPHERLQTHQHARLDPHRPDRQQVVRLVQIRPAPAAPRTAASRPRRQAEPSARIASRRNTDFRVFDSTISRLQRRTPPAPTESPASRRRSRCRSSATPPGGTCLAATSGSMSRRSSASGVGSARSSPVRLIFLFQVASSR